MFLHSYTVLLLLNAHKNYVINQHAHTFVLLQCSSKPFKNSFISYQTCLFKYILHIVTANCHAACMFVVGFYKQDWNGLDQNAAHNIVTLCFKPTWGSSVIRKTKYNSEMLLFHNKHHWCILMIALNISTMS